MHIHISQPGLISQPVVYTADSTAQLVENDTGVNLWIALDVDGNLYDLVQWKHTIGRPELTAACEQALNQMCRAIVAARLQARQVGQRDG